MTGKLKISPIPDVLDDIRKGKMIIVMDDMERENEGDFIIPADTITPETVNFMTKYGRGLMCVSIPKERADELSLEEMVQQNTALHQTRFYRIGGCHQKYDNRNFCF